MSNAFAGGLGRRDFLKLSGTAGALALAGCATTSAPPQKLGRVIVIGGGYGGATAARYLRMWSEGAIEVFLIEMNQTFVSCPLSNLVLGGSRKIEDITVGYGGLRNHGVQVINDEVTKINVDKKTIELKKIQDLSYDRLIVSPGVELMFDQVAALKDPKAQERVLHAWKAGRQTVALRRQLEQMRDGGVFVLSIPALRTDARRGRMSVPARLPTTSRPPSQRARSSSSMPTRMWSPSRRCSRRNGMASTRA